MCLRRIVSAGEGGVGEGGGWRGGRTWDCRSLMFPHASRTPCPRPLVACRPAGRLDFVATSSSGFRSAGTVLPQTTPRVSSKSSATTFTTNLGVSARCPCLASSVCMAFKVTLPVAVMCGHNSAWIPGEAAAFLAVVTPWSCQTCLGSVTPASTRSRKDLRKSAIYWINT